MSPHNFPCQWIHGSEDCRVNRDPPIQIHAYDANTFILRQNMCTHYEAPFLYLLFGKEKVLLQDTGAISSPAEFPLRATVDQLITEWLSANNRSGIELVVAHSHGHGDHTAADEQFSDRRDTSVVDIGQEAVSRFFCIRDWPAEIVPYDLGGRVLDIIPIPGHTEDHLAFFDRQTGLLLTGDTLYPGNLYISDWASYQASIMRLDDFCEGRQVCHILGTHIEMTDQPGVVFQISSTHHPHEHVLQLSQSQLKELQQALTRMGDNPVQETHDHFVIVPF